MKRQVKISNGQTFLTNGLIPDSDLKKEYDRVMKEYRSWFLQKNKVNFYNHKHMKDELCLSDACSEANVPKQPTEQQVRSALIWMCDGYAIKCGGGTKSDSQFESSLAIEIAHPTTGEDTKVVVIKKYSTKFDDVLITKAEIRELYKACSSKKQKTEALESQISATIHVINRAEQGFKVNFTSGYKKVSNDKLNQLWDSLKDLPKSLVLKHLDKIIETISQNNQRELVDFATGGTKPNPKKDNDPNLDTYRMIKNRILAGDEVTLA
jgi:hypothetical protein